VNIYNLSDVYNESSIPVLTFVEPEEFKDIVGSLKTKGKHITLSGPSGCGKTTLAKKALDKSGFGPGIIHWMSGRDHYDKDSLEAIFCREFGCGSSDQEIIDNLILCGMLIIDDFHHLNKAVRDKIAYSLKRWNELGIRVFIIGIAQSNKDLLDIDSELGIRNDPYEMKSQSGGFIQKIIEAGEKHLNIAFNDTTKREFITASQGIPSAIHVICRVACIRADVNETQHSLKEISTKMSEIKDGVIRIYKGKYHNKVIGLSKGKQQARSVHNTYFEIFKHICLLDKTEISVEELQDRIVRPIDDQDERNRKNTSFHNCLNNLTDVISQRGLGDALYYDVNSKVISIEDPSLRLYLTLIDLTDIEKAIKVRKTSFPWDVAVSFAGEDRKIVEDLRDRLNSQGYTVFYDFDVQYKLWGQNLRRKLGEVYANEAQFMVVFLSRYYPEKDWSNFELEIGKEARGKRTDVYLLPILLDDTPIVGIPKDIGYFDLRKHSMESCITALIQKIEE
jgi:hypothetical protein